MVGQLMLHSSNVVVVCVRVMCVVFLMDMKVGGTGGNCEDGISSARFGDRPAAQAEGMGYINKYGSDCLILHWEYYCWKG